MANHVICNKCGEQNLETREYCWKCYTKFQSNGQAPTQAPTPTYVSTSNGGSGDPLEPHSGE